MKYGSYMIYDKQHFLTPDTNKKIYIISHIFLQLFQGILFKFFFWKSLQSLYIHKC